MAKLKLSRALWRGESYYRKRSGTWRNSRTGEVFRGTPQKKAKGRLGFELRRANTYGSDPRGIKEALKRARDVHKLDEPRPVLTHFKKKVFGMDEPVQYKGKKAFISGWTGTGEYFLRDESGKEIEGEIPGSLISVNGGTER